MGKGKPKYCCYPNCSSCTLKDCIYNELEYEDIQEQNELDREIRRERLSDEDKSRIKRQKKYFKTEKGKEALKRYSQSQKGKAKQKKYNDSLKGKESRKRYENSEKGKASRKRYENSEKGKETARRKTKKLIESGKNAERCRAYYYRKKAQREAQKEQCERS